MRAFSAACESTPLFPGVVGEKPGKQYRKIAHTHARFSSVASASPNADALFWNLEFGILGFIWDLGFWDLFGIWDFGIWDFTQRASCVPFGCGYAALRSSVKQNQKVTHKHE